jgi:hypothetical protein
MYFNNGRKENCNFQKIQMSKVINHPSIFFLRAKAPSINKKMYLFPPALFRIKLRSQPFKLEILIFFKNRINKAFWLKVKKQSMPKREMKINICRKTI